MSATPRRRFPHGCRTCTVTLLCAVLALLSCRTTDLVLEDPVFRDDMVRGALEGDRYKITPEDFRQIRVLFSEGDPDYRLAGVLLAVQADDPFFAPLITAAALDTDERVSSAALEEIAANPESYRSAIAGFLADSDPARRSGGLRLLAGLQDDDLIDTLIGFFDDPDPGVRNQASFLVWENTVRTDPKLRAALNPADPRTAATAYRTLGRYADPNDGPLFVSAFEFDDAEIRKEAQLAMLRLGAGGLPFLHLAAADRGRLFRVRLSALDVIQGIRSVESLPVLLDLLDDPDRRIVEKANAILGTFGSEAVPTLAEVYAVSDPTGRLRVVELLGLIGSPAALPTLATALDDESDAVRKAAAVSFRSFGSEARPILRERAIGGSPRSGYLAVSLLVERNDPWLVSLEDETLNETALLPLMTTTGSDELKRYLRDTKVSRARTESVLTLREAWLIGGEYATLAALIENSVNSYYRTWRLWEDSAVAARSLLRRSFEELHVYFETRDLTMLEQAGRSREESRLKEAEASAYRAEIDAMDAQGRESERERIAEYRELQNRLVRIHQSLPDEFHATAEAVYTARGIDPVAIIRASTLLE